MAEVILIDEASESRRRLVNILRHDGHRVREAGSVPPALELRSNGGAVDLVVFCNHNDDPSTQRFLEQRSEQFGDAPIIIVTEATTVHSVASLLKRGAFAVVSQPIRRMTLLKTVHNALTDSSRPSAASEERSHA